jgi:uncharacterized membrane protein
MSEPRDNPESTDAPAGGVERTLVGISFPDAFRAQEFLSAATRLASQGRVRLRDAVFVAKDDNGRTQVRETVDLQPGRSALSGALWTGLFGLILGGPVGWVVGAGIGAGTGVVAAKIVDHGVTDEWVAWFREAVEAGTTTLVLLTEELDRAALVAELERFQGARLLYANVDPLWLDRMHTALGDRPASSTSSSSPTPAEPAPSEPIDEPAPEG